MKNTTYLILLLISNIAYVNNEECPASICEGMFIILNDSNLKYERDYQKATCAYIKLKLLCPTTHALTA
ncbi:hypothetical protein [Aliikangiella sp. IMCC44359]|uniref:hypothetical protein n=1 Tax=Aliikangiella sp. IMCC44359 TaxID=3459125 RepID=UPI00403B36FB